MIVRYWLKCGVCEKPHTVRIGVGLDASQTHKFPCCGCKEEIVLRMDLDHAKAGWRIVCVENCEPIHEASGAPIVNLDPNFVIPAAQQGKDMVFPRLGQMLAMHEASRSAPRSRFAELVPPTNRNFRPYRQPDYGAEWKLLRRAWSLARNGQAELSEKQVAAASAEFYPPDHAVEDLPNWIWRFVGLVCTPGYEPLFDSAIEAIEPLRGSSLWDDFNEFYNTAAEERGQAYFEVMKDFFDQYDEFAQVYFFISKGLPLPAGYCTTSTDFENVKMFYGNVYEHFTSLVEVLAALNNMLAGRKYDAFQTLTLSEYRKLDKPGRFRAFEDNEAFIALCSERDNQIRNASHHVSTVFDPTNQMLRYRSGK